MTARRPWLLGPAPDLLLGCGLGYALLVLALAALGIRMDTLNGWLPLAILVTGIPHYGATLLRVYTTAEARRRYARYAFHLGAVVWGGFVASLFSARLGTLFITLYLTWSPWHYTGQNFGLAMMYLRRGGFEVSPGLRRLVQGSFVLSFALVFVNIHGNASRGGSDPLYAASEAYRFAPLGIPEGISAALLGLAGVAYGLSTLIMLWRIGRQGGLARLLPVLALVASQAVWFVLPVVLGRVAPALVGPNGATAFAFIWVALAHSVQYLWISVYYARVAGTVAQTARATVRYLIAAVLVGAALWVVPAFVCGPSALGRLPFESGLGLLVASAVNVHHFILDGAIWKLRDAPVGKVLVEREGPAPAAAGQAGFPWPARMAFAAVGLLAAAAWVVATWEKEMGQRRATAAGDVERLEVAARRLALLGRDGPRIHVALGGLLAKRGVAQKALAQYEQSLSLAPTAAAWVGIGKLHEDEHKLEAARDAYQAAIALEPQNATALDRLAQVWLGLGDLGQALATSYRAVLAAPDRPSLRRHYDELLARVNEATAPPAGEEIVVGGDDGEGSPAP
jgi:hypothetical protein